MLISIIQGPFIGGCQYHRQLSPNGFLSSKGTDVIQTTSLRIIEDWSKWKVCQFNNKDMLNHAPVAKQQGLKIWFDLDDAWRLESRHPYYKGWNLLNHAGIVEQFIKEADVVTCASDKLADMASKLNKNTHILPNFINPLEPQFQYEHHEYMGGPVVFGWIGGSMHVQDVGLMASGLDKIYCDRELGNMFRIIYGGYVYGPEGQGDPLSENIAYYLKGNNSLNSNIHYGQIAATTYDRYGFMYQNIDVALAPLEANSYNECKSELKLIEAGHFGIPVIASDVHPYNKVIEHGVNGFLVKKSRGHKDWTKYIKHFIKNPQDIKIMGDNLKKTINERFNPETITDQRIRILGSL